MNTPQIIYITDPLCGWCYASAPILEKLINTPELPPVSLMHRALFTGPMIRWMSRSFSDYVMTADRRITQLSGQRFSKAYQENLFYRDHLIFDSWPTAKAIQVIKGYDSDKVIPFFKALQHARFTEGKVITDASVLSELAASCGLAADLFHQQFHYESRIEEAAQLEQKQTIELMDQVFTGGVPCFILQQENKIERIAHETYFSNPQGLIDQILKLL